MFLIVIAFIALVTGFVLQSNERTKTASIIAKVVGVVMLLVGLASSCIVQIEAGQVGVPTLFGKVSGRILNSGLNFVNPFVVVKKFDIRTQNYTMAGQYDEGDRQGEVRRVDPHGAQLGRALQPLQAGRRRGLIITPAPARR